MPKGGATSLIPVIAGVREDLDNFLKSFLNLQTQRFSDYKKLFQDRRMVNLHNGRSNSAEIIEFNEQLLVSCLPYMEKEVCPGIPRSLEERLFGLYSIYMFFYIQVPGHVTKIRVDPDASRNFIQLKATVYEEKIYDAYMACLKLIEDKAFKYVAFTQVYDPSLFKMFGSECKPHSTPILINVNDPFVRVKALLNSDLFKKLGVIDKERDRLKKATGIDFGEPQPNVYQACKDSLERNMEAAKAVSQLCSPKIPNNIVKPKLSRTEIREKAYSADLMLSRSRRHYTTDDIEMTQETFEFDPPKDSDECKSSSIPSHVKLEPKLELEIEEFDTPDFMDTPKIEAKPKKIVKRESIKTEKIKMSPSPQKRKRPRAPTPAFIPLPPNSPSKPSGRKTNNSMASEMFICPLPVKSESNLKIDSTKVKNEPIEMDSNDEDSFDLEVDEDPCSSGELRENKKYDHYQMDVSFDDTSENEADFSIISEI